MVVQRVQLFRFRRTMNGELASVAFFEHVDLGSKQSFESATGLL